MSTKIELYIKLDTSSLLFKLDIYCTTVNIAETVVVFSIYSSTGRKNRKQYKNIYKKEDFCIIQYLYILDNYIDLSFCYL